MLAATPAHWSRGGRLLLAGALVLAVTLLGVLRSATPGRRDDETLVRATSLSGHVIKNEAYAERAEAYCNFDAPAGAEGRLPMMTENTFSLVGATVLIRHGARSAIHDAVDDDKFSCALDADADAVLLDWGCPPQVVNPSTCAPGQLVERGFRQHLALGRFLGERFTEDEQSEWTWAARATNYQRTRASAAALLTGFFFSNVPGPHRIDVHDDETKETMWGAHPYRGIPCDKSKRFLAGRQPISRNCTSMAVESVLFSNTQTKGDRRLTSVADAVYSHFCELKEPACSGVGDPTKKRCLDDASAFEVLRAADAAYAEQYDGDFGGRRATQLGMYPLLSEILDGLRAAASSSKKVLTVLAAHDTVVAPAAAALGVFDDRWPPLAARLVFEAWKSSSIGTTAETTPLFVRVLYNGEPAVVPGCGDVLCPLDAVAATLDRLLDGATSFADACRVDDDADQRAASAFYGGGDALAALRSGASTSTTTTSSSKEEKEEETEDDDGPPPPPGLLRTRRRRRP